MSHQRNVAALARRAEIYHANRPAEAGTVRQSLLELANCLEEDGHHARDTRLAENLAYYAGVLRSLAN